jgi:hypothetical protein
LFVVLAASIAAAVVVRSVLSSPGRRVVLFIPPAQILFDLTPVWGIPVVETGVSGDWNAQTMPGIQSLKA